MSLRKLLSAAVGLALVIGTPVVLAPAAHAAPVYIAGSLQNVPTERILDTRYGFGAPKASLAPGATLTFTAGNASQASAVVLNVTAVNPGGKGYLTVFPAGTTRPVVSNLNFEAGQNVPNMVVTKLGTGGQVSIYNGSAAKVDVLADIHGFYGAGTVTDTAMTVVNAPVRVLDTRIGLGGPHTVPARSAVTFAVAGKNGIPADAASVIMNVTATNAVAEGYLTVYAGNTTPATSALNFVKAQNRANLGLSELFTDGTITIFNGSIRPVDVVADVSGYSTAGTPADDGSFLPTQYRALDSRGQGGPLPALSTGTLNPFLTDDGSFSDIFKAIVVNVVAVNPQFAGFLTTWDGTVPQPSVSNSNFAAGDNVAGSVVVPVNSDGTISVYNGSYGNVDIVVDVTGFYLTDLILTAAQSKSPAVARDAKAKISRALAAVKAMKAKPAATAFTTVTH